MRKINAIILHCSATRQGRDYKAKDIDRWHRAEGYRCIGYHYVIDLDGTVEAGRPVAQVGAHAAGHNVGSIGICYVGGCDSQMKPKDTRTPEQKSALLKLVKDLIKQYGLTAEQVHCHNEFACKACPSFSIQSFRQELDQH